MENTPQDIPQKRPRGRPKTGFNKAQYNKEYRLDHQEQLKDYAKDYNKYYNKKILEEKGTIYNRMKEHTKLYQKKSTKALNFLKNIKDSSDISENIRLQINNILN